MNPFTILTDWLGNLRARHAALHDLKGIASTEREVRTWDFPTLLEELRTAAARGDIEKGRRAWGEILSDLKPQAMQSREIWQSLINFGWFDEAEALMGEAVKRYPRDPVCAEGFAMVAQRCGRLETALERWAVFRKRFPHNPEAYSQTGACLGRLGRMKEADAVLLGGMAKFPRDFICQLEYARLAEIAREWPEALRRWQQMREAAREPAALGYQMGSLGVARALIETGQLDEADEVLTDFRKRFPLDIGAALDFGRVAERRGDWPEAARRWEAIKSRLPLVSAAYIGFARALRMCERFDEADAILSEAVERFPRDAGIALDYAVVAELRKDFVEAARRWESMRLHFPDHDAGYKRGADVLAVLGQSGAEQIVRAEYLRRFTSQEREGATERAGHR